MISFRPLAVKLAKTVGRPMPDLLEGAQDTWQAAPGGDRHVPPAICLPGQIDRIRDTEFTPLDAVIRSFRGGFDTVEHPTIGYRLENVDLVDGVLYAKGRQRHLRARQSRRLSYPVPREAMRGAMYESWLGNRWFGNWLSDDCLTYMLATAAGLPVTTATAPTGHVPRYETLLQMTPQRRQSVHFDELILFDDLPNNAGKARRARDMRDRLLAGRTTSPVPGVFLLRGKTGDQRVLENELKIAEHLAATRGFSILDPTTASVDQIADLCGQAAVIAGVEGSHLVHGLAMMPPGAV